VQIEMDDCPECVALSFEKDKYAITLGPAGQPTDDFTPMLYTPKV
jgi:hypothetical protein